MNSQRNSSKYAHVVVQRYATDPSPDNGEVVLKTFENLIAAYVRYLKYGQVSPAVRRLDSMCEDWLSTSLQAYEIEDLEQEVRLAVLKAARKGYVVPSLPFLMMTRIRQLSRSPSVRSTNIGEHDHEQVDQTGEEDQDVHLLVDELSEFNDRERFYLHELVKGRSHNEIRERVAQRFGELPLSRRRTSEVVLEIRERMVEALAERKQVDEDHGA